MAYIKENENLDLEQTMDSSVPLGMSSTAIWQTITNEPAMIGNDDPVATLEERKASIHEALRHHQAALTGWDPYYPMTRHQRLMEVAEHHEALAQLHREYAQLLSEDEKIELLE